MALIKCPECGKVFSDRAAHCPQCGLPTSDALEMITETPETQSPLPLTKEQEEPVEPVVSSPLGGKRGGLEPAGVRRNLLTYILIVAVIVLAIVCIALVLTTSGMFNGTVAEEPETADTMQVLPPDTTPARIEEEPQVKPVLRTEVPEEIPAESEEIEIEAPQPAAPAASEPAPQPAPEPAPAPTEE